MLLICMSSNIASSATDVAFSIVRAPASSSASSIPTAIENRR